jgi:hypothetical protein
VTALLIAPVVLALLVVVWLPHLHGDDATDAECARIDGAIDRENAGWRNA